MFTFQVDEDVSLKMFTVDDTEEFYQLTSSSKNHLKKWLSWVDQINSVKDTREYIKDRLSRFAENGGYPESVLIIYKGKIAGTVGFNYVDRMSRVGEIGYWLGESYEGKGIMTRALKAFINYGFSTLNLNRIEMTVAVENERSRRLPERLGFTKEGRLRKVQWLYDHFVDHIMYSLLAEEWKSNDPQKS